MPEPADRPPLRDQIAEALHTGRCCTGHIPRITDAVLHAIEGQTADRPDWRPAYDRLAHALTEALTRAETAERQREQALDQIATERRGRLAAEAAVRRVRALHQPTRGQGYDCDEDDTPGSYGDIAQVCTSCGTADEYGVRCPCPTLAALDAEQPSHTEEHGDYDPAVGRTNPLTAPPAEYLDAEQPKETP